MTTNFSLAQFSLDLVAPVLVAAISLSIGMAVIYASGNDPLLALSALWDGALGNTKNQLGTLSRMVPIVLIATAWICAFSTRRVNIGFEGQILAGGMAAAYIGINMSGVPAAVHLPVAVLAGFLGGAIWVAVPTYLWANRNVPEIISTLLMNMVAFEMVSWLVRGPMQEERGVFARTDPILPSAQWPDIVDGSRLHYDVVLAAAVLICAAIVLSKSIFGLKMRFAGANRKAAFYMGFNPTWVSSISLLVSGGIAGLAGSSLVLAQPTATVAPNFSSGYGFEGIVVALLVRNNPLAVIPASFLFAVFRQGSGLMEARAGVSSTIVELMLGIMVVLMAAASPHISRLLLNRKPSRSNSKVEVTT